MNGITNVYSRITAKIIADLEQGVRPWIKPWSSEHAAGRITRPLRHNGVPYERINVVMLWSAATAKGYACPLWLTFKQALELDGNVRQGETGELVIYASRITRTETDDRGEELEREIFFFKGYNVFNAEQCDSLPRTTQHRPRPLPYLPSIGLSRPIASSPIPARKSATGADRPTTPLPSTTCRSLCSTPFGHLARDFER